MSNWKCAKGECILIPSGPSNYKHLFTILFDPIVLPSVGQKPHTLSVSITTLRENLPYDDACVLEPGEHPFIKHRSYVDYRHTRIDSAEHLEKLITSGYVIQKESCSLVLINKIISGALKSNRISREFKFIIQKSMEVN